MLSFRSMADCIDIRIPLNEVLRVLYSATRSQIKKLIAEESSRKSGDVVLHMSNLVSRTIKIRLRKWRMVSAGAVYTRAQQVTWM